MYVSIHLGSELKASEKPTNLQHQKNVLFLVTLVSELLSRLCEPGMPTDHLQEKLVPYSIQVNVFASSNDDR
jgi:hypothetical protein